MGMVGIRGDVFVVAPASSFHHNQPHHHHHSLDPNIHSDIGVGLIPLMPPMHIDDGGDDLNLNTNNRTRGSGGGGIQLWQNQNQNQNQNQSSYLKKPLLFDQDNSMNLLNVGVGGGGGGTSGSASSTTTCQDCGNQAKKDCTHRRCRTCCKSRGYDCSTHVKSTWVPAARRRERQQLSSTALAASSGSTSGVKKPRLITSQTTTSHTSTSNTTPPRSFDTSSSHQDASCRDALPGQICAPAVFKCVRVTAVDDGEDEYAYQAVVKIGGRVFKGFLYDQGIEGRDSFPNISELHLGGTSGNGGRNGASSTTPVIDPSDVYGVSGGGLLGGTSYGNQIN